IGSFRMRLLQWRMLLTLGVLVALVLPHGLWLARNWSSFVRLACLQPQIRQWQWSLSGMAVGAVSLVTNIVAILTPVSILLVCVFPECLRSTGRPLDPDTDAEHMLGRFFLVALGLGLLVIVIAGATEFHERWLQPFTLWAPLYFFARLRCARLPEPRL